MLTLESVPLPICTWCINTYLDTYTYLLLLSVGLSDQTSWETLEFSNWKSDLHTHQIQTVKCLPKCGRPRFDPWVGKILWRRKWQLNPVLLPGKSHAWRSPVGYSPWGHESDTTEWLHLIRYQLKGTKGWFWKSFEKSKD